MTDRRRCSVCLILLAAAFPATAQDAIEPPRGEPDESSLGVEADLSLTRAPFGTAGTQYFGVVGAGAIALESDDDSTDLGLAATYHRFLIDDIEFIGELGGWYFDQDGDGAWGVNPGFTLRWHYLNRDAWSLFADAGIGLLFSTDDVPVDGTDFNFMPRLGLGGTVRLTETGVRLVAGGRWHHISNARLNGDDDNPDRDGIALYAGLMFPF